MSERKFYLFLVLVLIGIPLFIGCFESDKGTITDKISPGIDEIGNLDVKMTFNESGKVVLKAPDGVTTVKIFVDSWSTSFAAGPGEGVVEGVPVGSHSIYAEGWSVSGKTHESPSQTVSIEKGKTALVNLVMSPWTPPPPASGMGTTWTLTTSNMWGGYARSGHTATEFQGKIWVIGGYHSGASYNCVWYSSDGWSWDIGPTMPVTGIYNHSSFVYDNKLWVMGGAYSGTSYSNVYYTTGTSWNNVYQGAASSPLYSTEGHGGAGYDGKLWVFGYDGGSTNYYSTDGGLNWELGSTMPQRHYGESFTYHNGKIWGLGGSSSDQNYYFTGSSWDPMPTTPSTSIPTYNRMDHTSVSDGSRLWVIGGYDDSLYRNDVWYTTDGSSWNLTKPNDGNGFPGRENHASVYFGGKLWVIGGSNGGTYYSDVWYSGP